MRTKRRFTEEEDRVILSKISKNPSNIAQCLRELSVELNRSFATLQTRYYKVLVKKNRNNRANATFTLFGEGNMNVNRKITRPDTQQPVNVRRSKWRRILDILFE